MAQQTVELARGGSVVVLKKYGMTREEFVRDHLLPGVPVVIGDATASWPARTLFTVDFFKQQYGDRQIHVQDHHYRLSEYIDLLNASSAENPAPYPGKLSLDDDFPELMPHIQPRFGYSLPDRIPSPLIPRMVLGKAANYEIFFGGPGGRFPYVHYDYMGFHAWINQLVGEKEFTVIPPWESDCVYPNPDNPWVSLVGDVKNPDLDRYPAFRRATVLSFIVGPGETMFIPNGWWHTTVSKTVTISVAFDTLNSSNWSRFMNEVRQNLKARNPVKRVAALTYLSALGLAWNGLD